MKKRFSIVISAALAAFVFTGCSASPSTTFGKTYWDEKPSMSDVVEVHEKLTYTVAFNKGATSEETKDLVPALSGNGNLSFVSDGSSYVTELRTENGEYVYNTTLIVKGYYEYGDGLKYEVDDCVKTETRFKGIGDGFKPVYAKKEEKSVVPNSASPTGEENFKTIEYESEINYEGKDATVTLAPEDGSKDFFSYQEKTFPIKIKNYAKKNYIDNELIPLLFRTFAYDGTLSYDFNTIDSVTGVLQSARGATITAGTSANEPKRVEIELKSFGNANRTKLTAQGVTFSTRGEYGQNFLYVYYALGEGSAIDEKNEWKHYPVKIFQPALYGIGYYEFTLSKAE